MEDYQIEDYVPYDVAEKLKARGFRAKCTACYDYGDDRIKLVSGRIDFRSPRYNTCKHYPPINAPTIQMALKFVRSNGYFIEVTSDVNDHHWFYVTIYFKDKESWSEVKVIQDTFDSYEAAEVTGLRWYLDNIE